MFGILRILFKGMVELPKVVWDSAMAFGRDFRIHNLNNDPLLPKVSCPRKWNKPTGGCLKVNFDAAWLDWKVGMGFIAKDGDGFVHRGGMQTTCNVVEPAWWELAVLISSTT